MLEMAGGYWKLLAGLCEACAHKTWERGQAMCLKGSTNRFVTENRHSNHP